VCEGKHSCTSKHPGASAPMASRAEGEHLNPATGNDTGALQKLSRLLDSLCSKTSESSSSSPAFCQDLASTAETIHMIETMGSTLQEKFQEKPSYNPDELNELTLAHSEPRMLQAEYQWLREPADSLTLKRALRNAEARQEDIATQKEFFCQQSQDLLKRVEDSGLDQVEQHFRRLQDEECTSITTASQCLAEVAAEDTDKSEGERRLKDMETVLQSKFTLES